MLNNLENVWMVAKQKKELLPKFGHLDITVCTWQGVVRKIWRRAQGPGLPPWPRCAHMAPSARARRGGESEAGL